MQLDYGIEMFKETLTQSLGFNNSKGKTGMTHDKFCHLLSEEVRGRFFFHPSISTLKALVQGLGPLDLLPLFPSKMKPGPVERE